MCTGGPTCPKSQAGPWDGSPQPTQGRDLMGCVHQSPPEQAVPTPGAEAGPQQHPPGFTPHFLLPSQGSTYFTPKQSRHELIYIQRRCTGDYYLTQNQKKPSDKSKNSDRLSKPHASAYIAILISFLNTYFTCSPQKGLLAASHQPDSAFPLLEACFCFG